MENGQFTLLFGLYFFNIYVHKLYKIIDRFADDINPYNFSKRK